MSQQHDAELWYAVYCQPLKEWLSRTWLTSQLGLNVYLPELKGVSGGRAVYRPFFPRYLFVQADLEQVATSQINATPGVQGLVTIGGGPQPLGSAVIRALRQRLDQLNQCAGRAGATFQPGSAVRVKSGPLQGLEAVFVEAMSPGERVRVLIEFLGRQQVIEIPAASLEAGGAPGAQRQRRTRGKGRTIRTS